MSRSNVYASLRRIARKLGVVGARARLSSAAARQRRRLASTHRAVPVTPATGPAADVPVAGTGGGCAVSGGADSLALLVLAVAAGCRSPPSTSTTACGPARPARPTWWRRRRRSAPGSGPSAVDVAPGPNLEARARRRALAPRAARGR